MPPVSNKCWKMVSCSLMLLMLCLPLFEICRTEAIILDPRLKFTFVVTDAQYKMAADPHPHHNTPHLLGNTINLD